MIALSLVLRTDLNIVFKRPKIVAIQEIQTGCKTFIGYWIIHQIQNFALLIFQNIWWRQETYDLRVVTGKDQTSNWDEIIRLFLMDYRSAMNKCTGLIPSNDIFNKQLRLSYLLGDLKIIIIHLTIIYENHLDNRKKKFSNRMEAWYDIKWNNHNFQESNL